LCCFEKHRKLSPTPGKNDVPHKEDNDIFKKSRGEIAISPRDKIRTDENGDQAGAVRIADHVGTGYSGILPPNKNCSIRYDRYPARRIL
jgi:hypothetical protein